MTNDFRSYNDIYIVYDCKNENHWSLLTNRNTNTQIQLPFYLNIWTHPY